MTTYHLKFADGSTNQLNLWIPGDDAYTVFFILPAMGVRASYYSGFAEKFSQRGVAVATMDFRGHGNSSLRASRTCDWGYAQLVSDIQEAAFLLKKRINFLRLYLVGHSMGGQIAHLTAAKFPSLINGVFSIASSDPYYKMWKSWQQFPFYLATLAIHPVTWMVGHFPGYFFGFAKREARTAIGDWARAVRTGKFILANDSFDYQRGKFLYTDRIVAISIQDDWLAPRRAVEFTLGQFQNAKLIKHVELSCEKNTEQTLTHFNWVKYPERIIDTILKNIE